MSKIDAAVLWGPKVLGRDRLDERRWAYIVEAPFDMLTDPTDLIGMKAYLNGDEVEIRGFVPRMPPRPIKKGDAIELLVLALRE
jgi:hypothetical protein